MFLVSASAASWGCVKNSLFVYKVRTGAFQVHGVTGGLHQSPSKPLPSQNTCRGVNAEWMIPQSCQQDKERQKQGTQLFPRALSDPLMYLGVSCGQTRATAATWILFSACWSLPYHAHLFLGGKVALCVTPALSLWQCQAVNSLDLMTL